MEQNENENIDLLKIVADLWKRRKVFFKVLPTVFVLSCAYVLCIPRTYTSSVELAPELGGDNTGGFSGIASIMGLDMENNPTGDAITPLLYPDLMDDNAFVASLYDIHVQSIPDDNGDRIDTTYRKYLTEYTRKPFWAYGIALVKSLFTPEDKTGSGEGDYDPYYVSRTENSLMNMIRSNVNISVDRKSGVITINTKAQDALIARTLADSVRLKLQDFITDYRTGKVRVDLEYYRKLRDDAWARYDSISEAYAMATDANVDLLLAKYSLPLEKMEREVQRRYNHYTSMESNYQAAFSKLQERTPVYTILKGANVPVKPKYPRRMITVLGLTILAFIVTASWLERKELSKLL